MNVKIGTPRERLKSDYINLGQGFKTRRMAKKSLK